MMEVFDGWCADDVVLCLRQGVVSLEPLGKKGYSVPKAGTIQVVSRRRRQASDLIVVPTPSLCFICQGIFRLRDTSVFLTVPSSSVCFKSNTLSNIKTSVKWSY